MREIDLQNTVLLALNSRPDVRLFRHETGAAWTGKVIEQGKGWVTIAGARMVRFGWFVGAPDLMGWRTIEIEGSKIAQLIGVELKSEKGNLSGQQKHAMNIIRAAGGIAGVVRSVKEAEELLGL